MWSVLKAGWRVIVRRAASDKAVLAAVFITIVFAITLMAAGPIYANAVTISSLRRTLVDAPITESSVAIRTRVDPVTYQADDGEVLNAMSDMFAPTGAATYRRGTSDSFSTEGLGVDRESDLVVFRFFTEMEDRTEIVTGAWPGESGELVQVAILEEVGSALDLEVGDTFDVISRRDENAIYSIEVSGLYRVLDASDAYWLEDELDLNGVSRSVSFTTYGPLVVTDNVYFETVARSTSTLRWSTLPNHELIDVEDVGPMLGRLDDLDKQLNGGRPVGNEMRIETDLAPILRQTQRSLLVTRSAVLILTLQLAVLAGYALLLSAGLLAETRQLETDTLRARGASPRQLLGMATMEGLFLTVPALLIGPPLAAWALRIFNTTGPLAGIGLGIEPTVTATSWALAGLAAVGCVLAIVIPTHRSAKRRGSIRAAQGRQETSSMARRAGIDIALLAIAAVGIWQLARYGTPLTQSIQGRLGVDPLLVAAPALALTAGAILSIRALPLLAHLAERAVSRGRRLVVPLGVWHLSRQSHRYTRSALMLMLSLAIGIFALSYDATWQESQTDRADFSTGSDLLVAPSEQLGSSVPSAFLKSSYEGITGYEQSVAIASTASEISGADLPVKYVILESGSTAESLYFRTDLADKSIEDLMAGIGADRPEITGQWVESEPTSVAVRVAMTVDPLDPDLLPANPAEAGIKPTLRVVFADADGMVFRVDLGAIDASGQLVWMSGGIGSNTESGDRLDPRYPIRLVGLELRSLAPFDPFSREATLIIEGLYLADDDSGWQPINLETDPQSIEPAVSVLRLAVEEPSIALTSQDEATVRARLGSGSTASDIRQAVYHMIWLDRPPVVTELPILAASALLDDLGLDVGDALPLNGLTGFNGLGRVVGRVDAFPTVDPHAENAIVVDYPSYLAATFGPGVFPPNPENYLVKIGPRADPAEIAQELRNKPFSSSGVITREEAATELFLDPVSLGAIGSLMMGMVAAAVLAAIGFLVNVIVSTRERLGQFALMRAIGLSMRQLVAWMTFENGVTVIFALIFGTTLGLVLSEIALPLIAVTQQATSVVPELIVVHPWPKIFVLQIGIVAALAVAVSMVSSMLRRLELAALLRTGDE